MRPIGYLELIARFGLDVLAPEVSSYALEKGHRRSSDEDGRRAEYYPRTAAPGDEWTDHLIFAFKHEGINLEVLSALFGRVPEGDLSAFVERSPTGRYARVAWFLFEWLTGRSLPVPDLTQGNYVPVLDPARYVTANLSADAMRVRRQRVLNNLPGTPAYCPLVRRTAGLEAAITERLEARVREVLSRFSEEVVFRATQYLFVKETKSSYEIEHLRPDQRRTARFVELLRRAGTVACETEQELTAIQQLIVDQRYAAQGFRDSQNYIGQNLGPGRELVHFVPPKPEDLRALMEGWAICCRRLAAGGVHPVVAAAITGFGFVFLHPFEDGNGRLHRFLIHHQLAAAGFTPEGVVFPVSAVMLRDKRRYDAVLESYSREVMRHVEYRLDDEGALHVLNDTARFYRYPDLTHVAERLYAFIRDTIDREFTVELEYLTAFDAARRRLAKIVDMPDQRLDLFIRLCLQGAGRLSAAKRGRFSELTDAEIARMEAVVVGARARTRLEKG